MKKILLFSWMLLIPLFINAQEEARLMRFPAIHGENIVFSYAGDLYQVSSNGGTARKLTGHDGYEMFAKFSPDGKQIAFTGQYDGNTEVFVMPADGGVPERLTVTATLERDKISDRMGPNNIVMDWTPDGKYITYRSRRHSFNSFKGHLFNVPLNGGLSRELPLAEGGFCSYSPDGDKLAFNRVFREFRTWKYYKGGMADDVWIFDFNTKEVKNITENDAQDIIPMWAGDEIFFLSDRDRIMNLFVYDLNTGEVSKVTHFDTYDIKFPSLGKDYIVFENGGYIYKMNIETKTPEKVPVYINNDFIYARNEMKDASELIRSADLSPGGERVVMSARGDIFTLPADKGITYNITRTSGAHEREAVWSPDGKHIAYLSDKSGEFEIYIEDQDGGNVEQLTSGATTYKFDIKWSPDSKKILWSDRELRLRYVDIESKNITEVHEAKHNLIYHYNWSPDSKWITFTRFSRNDFPVISVYNIESNKVSDITDNWYDSYSPRFSNDGKYVVFVSSRDFNPTYSRTEWNHIYRNMSRVYLAILDKDTPSPFKPENTIVKAEDKEKDTDGKKDEQKNDVNVEIDFDGIHNRIISLPHEPANYSNVYCIDGKVYYNVRKDDSRSAKMYNLSEQEEKDLGNIQFSIPYSAKKMLVKSGKNYGVIDLPSSEVNIKDPVSLDNMKVMVNIREEWQQIFDESWRQMRDFFYVENMHGVDWPAIHEKYEVLVPHAKHRDDLTYIIGEMIGELNVGHAYVQSGERPEPERIKTGLLGADLTKHESGYFKVDRILDGANWSNELRSPLQEVGVGIEKGDYLVSINGISLKDKENIYELLIYTAGKTVEIGYNRSPKEEGAKIALVKPIDDESSLYYFNWVQNNIRKVNEATNGEVGYIHIPDMGPGGLNQFAKYFYPQLDKKGLIIDDRGNGGGNVSPMILERLQRKVYRANMRRGIEEGRPMPGATMMGPQVVLIDKYSASDGDLFPYGFRELELGTIIGTRTWGGVVGITGTLPFIDGAELRKPEFASYSSEESDWIIEGYGVEPDIYLDNDPYKEYIGDDEQLQKAIEVILKQIEEEYEPLPPVPAGPDKTK